MFYCVDILRKNGTFGVIWLAATRECGLKKRDFLSVNTRKTCLDLIDYILHQGKVKPRLSLYLSSQLTYGTIKVYNKQINYLLNDVMELVSNLRYQPQFTSIDVCPPKRKKDSKFTDASLLNDFNLLDTSHLVQDLSCVHTLDPQNFWQPGMRVGEEGGRGGELDVSRHTVPLADITMNLDSAILEQQLSAGPMQEMDFLPPLPADALLNEGVVDKGKDASKDLTTGAEQGTGTPTKSHLVTLDTQPPDVQELNLSNAHEQIQHKPESLKLNSLEPIGVGGRMKRRRKKRMLVDEDMSLSKKQMEENFKDTASITRDKIELHDVRFVTAHALMQESGCPYGRLVASPLKKLFKQALVTTQVSGEDEKNEEEEKEDRQVTQLLQRPLKQAPSKNDQAVSHSSLAAKAPALATSNRWDSSVEVARDASRSMDFGMEQSKSSSVLKHSSNTNFSINLSASRRTSERSQRRGHNKENLPEESMLQHDSHYNTFYIDQLLKGDAGVLGDIDNVVLSPTAHAGITHKATASPGIKRAAAASDPVLSPLKRPLRQDSEDFGGRVLREVSRNREVTFKQLLSPGVSSCAVAECFHALLIGLKDRRWRVRQSVTYGDIYITSF